MALTPEERAQVADLLYRIDEIDQSEVDAAWASVSAERFAQLRSGEAKAFTRAEVEAYLERRLSARSA